MNVESGHTASVNGSDAAVADTSSPRSGAGTAVASGRELVRKRPEVLVGAAFAGGIIAAFLLRRLGR
jgi:hypothetical protein